MSEAAHQDDKLAVAARRLCSIIDMVGAGAVEELAGADGLSDAYYDVVQALEGRVQSQPSQHNFVLDEIIERLRSLKESI
jgi:hypothetical protein